MFGKKGNNSDIDAVQHKALINLAQNRKLSSDVNNRWSASSKPLLKIIKDKEKELKKKEDKKKVLETPEIPMTPIVVDPKITKKMNPEFFVFIVVYTYQIPNITPDIVSAFETDIVDINDFTLGLKALLKPDGVITLEFPHLMRLIDLAQFDTIYHEHFSYISLYTAQKIFKTAGLRIWNVDELCTHGGSIRIYGCHERSARQSLPIVDNILAQELDRGMQSPSIYLSFQNRADKIKNELIEFLVTQKKLGKNIAAYGAAAKGSTLLNYAGIKPDLLPFICDAAKAKQGKFMPGSHIPILPPSALAQNSLDYVLILPWNIAPEVKQQNENLLAYGTKFITAVPELKIA